jgi:hypothetical protein
MNSTQSDNTFKSLKTSLFEKKIDFLENVKLSKHCFDNLGQI